MRKVSRRRGIVVAAGAVALAAAGPAAGAITIQVSGPNGIPITNQNVRLTNATGGYENSASTDATGKATFTLSTRNPGPAPYTASVDVSDYCQTDSRKASAPGLADGGTATLSVDVKTMCAYSSYAADTSGLVDAVSQTVLAAPGGTVDLKIFTGGYGASGITVFAGPTPISAPTDSGAVRVTAPAGGYSGPISVSYTVNNTPVSYNIGTMQASMLTVTPPNPGPIDIEAIVDMSGSMAGTDPKRVRSDALSLLVDLMRKGDRLGAVGFDDELKPIIGPTEITGDARTDGALKATLRRAVVEDGGTNYGPGMDEAYTALTTTPGIDPARQKAVVFLTDGAVSSYANNHLRFAYNPSGRTWPVCAVQLGPAKSFDQKDVDRLKRIAAETGGQYFAADKASQLTNIYNRCFNLNTAQQTLFTKTFTFTPRSRKLTRKRVPKGLAQVTFFANWGDGAYRLVLRDPKGKVVNANRPPKGVSFRRGATFAFYRVVKPRPGLWEMQLQNVRLTLPKDSGSVSITTPKK